jgi:hypothetical protein
VKLGVLVEGDVTEMKAYSAWIPAMFPNLARVESPIGAGADSYWIVSGGGQPQIFDRITNFAMDCADNSFDLMWVIVDSEGDDPGRVGQKIAGKAGLAPVPIVPIIQNICIETWCLGSKQLLGQASTNAELLAFRSHYDTFRLDPEACPAFETFGLVNTHFRYLKAAFAEHAVSYTKRNAGAIANSAFFAHLVSRSDNSSGHLGSFRELLVQARLLGSTI